MFDFAILMRLMRFDRIFVVAIAIYLAWLVISLCHHGLGREIKKNLALLADRIGGLTSIDETECPEWADESKWKESLL